ncbi:MAG TPA: DoxX family protein [Nocardioidaceae bacterium]|nr:DoxX family protein [Nocardioidaceae bacterium]
MKSLSSAFGRAADLGPLLLRVGIGTVFAWHGWLKLDGGVSNFAGFLDSLGVPLPEVVAWLQVMAEGIGGLLLIAGLLTRFVTLPLIGIMIGAILMVKVDVGFIVADAAGAAYETALLAGLLGLLFMGPGRLSLDAVAGLESSAAPLQSGHRSPVAA